jgi:hypothetical protein
MNRCSLRSALSAPLRLGLLALAAASALAIGSGCTTRHQVKVDAISRPTTEKALSYRIRHKGASLGAEEGLREQEVAGFVRTALSGKGMYEAPADELADMVIEVDFGIEKPRPKLEKNSVPVYTQVGGGVRYETVPVADPSGRPAVRTVAVYQPPRTELVGYQDMVIPVSVYEKYLTISAREARPAEGQPPVELWSVRVSSEDGSDDLRRYLPLLASVSIDYIAADSSTQKTVRVGETDADVKFIRRGM